MFAFLIMNAVLNLLVITQVRANWNLPIPGGGVWQTQYPSRETGYDNSQVEPRGRKTPQRHPGRRNPEELRAESLPRHHLPWRPTQGETEKKP